MTTTGTELFRTILERPGNDTVRLIMADWLEEDGQAERAEFVHLQVRLAKGCLRCNGKGWEWDSEPYGYGRHKELCSHCGQIRTRQNELLAKYWTEWAPKFPDQGMAFDFFCENLWTSNPYLIPSVEFRRGFVSTVHCNLDCFYSDPGIGPQIVLACPLQRVVFLDKVPLQSGWYADGQFGERCRIPGEWWEETAGLASRGFSQIDRLSIVAVNWARKKAGLPALET